MENTIENKKNIAKKGFEILGPTYEKGKPEGEEVGQWRQKLATRTEKLKYIKLNERY